MIVNTRVDRWYTVADKDPLQVTGQRTSRIDPDTAHVVRSTDTGVTVYVRGHILRKDGTRSRSRGSAVYGNMGTPLEHAPIWVRTLAALDQLVEDVE